MQDISQKAFSSIPTVAANTHARSSETCWTSASCAKGYPYDNSVCESFFKYLKMEETDRKHYRTREELRLDLFSYIDGYYNSKRIHSSIGYKTPNEIEKEFFTNNC